jgi:hypothetical protein
MAMETVRQNFSKDYNLKVNYRKYRFLQILHGLRKIVCNRKLQKDDLLDFSKSLFWWEKILYFTPFLLACFIRKFQAASFVKALANTMPYRFSHASHGKTLILPGKYNNILEVFQNVKIDKTLISTRHIPVPLR